MSTPNAQAETGDSGDAAPPDDFDLPLTDDDGSEDATDDDAEVGSLADITPKTVAAAAKPVAKPETPPAESALDELRKKREARRAQLDAEKNRVDAAGKVKELETRLSKFDAAEGLAKGGKKLEAIKALGYDLNDLISEHLETMEGAADAGVPVSSGDKELLKRLETLEAQLKGKEDAEKETARETAERRKQEEQRAAADGGVSAARSLLQAGGERFEVINASESHAEVYSEFAAYCQRHNLAFTTADEAEAVALFTAFAERANKTMADRVATAARTKTVQALLGGKTTAARTVAGAAANTAKTQGRGHVAPPVENSDDDDDDYSNPRARARRIGRSIRITE